MAAEEAPETMANPVHRQRRTTSKSAEGAMLDHAYFILEIPEEKEADKEKRLKTEEQLQQNNANEELADDDDNEEEGKSPSNDAEDRKDCELKGEPLITRVLAPRLFEAGTHKFNPIDFVQHQEIDIYANSQVFIAKLSIIASEMKSLWRYLPGTHTSMMARLCNY